MQNQNDIQLNPTSVTTPNPGLATGVSANPVSPLSAQPLPSNLKVSSLTSIGSPSLQVQEAFMDQSSLEGQSQNDAIDAGSLFDKEAKTPTKIKHRSSKAPFVITALTLLVALVIAGLGSYFAQRSNASSTKSISQQVAEQSVDSTKFTVDPLSLIAPAGGTGQQLQVNGSADITGTIVATSFSGNGSAITNLKASNCVDCIALQPETPGTAQVGGINVTGSGLFGKLGVGTQTPAYSVDVLGDVNASTSIKVGGVTVCTVAGCFSQNAITSAVTKLNNLTGPINLQGVAADQINVTQVGNNLSLSLPQGISTTSTPSFASLTLTSSLAVASGGTGGTIFTQYGLLVGNGVNGLTVTNPQSSAGLCLISNTGAAPSFQACPGGVGGSSVSTTTPGTVNSLAKFTAANEIGDSNIIDDGSTVSVDVPLFVNGDINASGLISSGALDITPGSDLTVGAINQQFTLQGSSTSVITARSGSNTTTVGFVEPTSPDKTILFPNESGTLCLQNSVDCGFALSGSGVADLNGLTSSVTVVGTANQVIVTNGASIVLSAPQDIATSSSPQFAGLNLTGDITLGSTRVVYANNITQTSAGQSITVDAGVDGITLKANNRTFILPTSGGANQTICTTGISCVAGGGQAVLLAVGSAQTDNTTSPSIYIDKTNSGGNILQLQTSGIDKLIVDGNGTLKVNTIVPISGTFTLGNVANAFDIQGDGASTISSKTGLFTTTVGFAAASANKTISFPNLDGTVCLSSGNCSGAAAALTTPGGTIGRLTKFTGVQEIDNSIIGEDSLTSVVTINSGSLVIQGAPLSSALTLGVAGLGGVTGKIDFKNATNSNTVSLQSGTTSVNGLTFTLPTTGGSSGQCITTDGSGVLGYSTCLSGAGGGAGGVTSLNGISGVVNINGTTNQVNVNLASGASPMTLSLPQSIASTSDVAFRTLSLSGTASAGISIGSIGSSGRIILSDGAATPHTVSLLPATQTVNKTITIPDFSGASATLPLTASGFISITAAGDIQTTGQLSVASGGTNASTISGARSNLGAAASGANSDITSTTVLNTITPSGSLTVGSNSFSFTLQGNSSSSIKATSGVNATTLSFITPTGNRSIQLPDESGTVCTTGSICSGYASSSSLSSGLSGVTLQSAYTNGNSIAATDNRDISFTLADTTTDPNFTITTAQGSSGFTTFGLADGSNPSTPAQLVLVKNNDTNQNLAVGVSVQSAGGTITTAFDASGLNITNALSIGTHAIAGTNFSVTGAGAITAVGINSGTGLIQGTGGLTVSAGTTTLSGDLLSNGNTTIGNATSDRLTVTSQILGGTPLVFQGATDNSFTTSFAFIDPTANRTITFGDETGIICTTGSICSGYASSSSLSTAFSNAVELRPLTTGTAQVGNLNINGEGKFGTGIFGSGLTVSSGGLTVSAGGASIVGNTSISTTAGNTLGLGNSTGTLTVTGSSLSTFVLNGITVDATEFNRLDGKDAALVDTNDAVTTAITGTGALASGSIASGFGTIATTNTITGTTVNGTTGVNTGAGAGTQRIDASGNLANIGTITSGLINGQTISSTANFTGTVSLNGATTLTANFIQTGAATTFLQKSDSATAFQLQDAGGNEGLLFDTSTNHLKIFDNIAGTSGAYADIYYSGGAAVFAASTGGTTIGNGTGNVDITLANNSEKFNFVHNGTATPSADTDFYISRALTGGVNNLSGAVLKVEDLSSGSGTNTTDILSINQSNVSSTGNLIIAVTGSITEKFKVSNSGVVTSLGNMNTTGGAIQTNSTTRIDNSGNLTGIGTISASYLTSTSLAALKLVNTASVFDFASTDGNTAILKIPQKASGSCSTATAEGLIIQNAAGTQSGHMCIDSAGLKIYANQITASSVNVTGTDVAENYSDPSNTIEPGDLVALLDNGSIKQIEKASLTNSSRLFGVAATSPGMLLSGIGESGITDLINPKAIALSGRIPTKISTENGNIAVGDYLTVSSVPGVAMRATGPSMVIGRALEGYDGVGVVKIEVMAQNFYYAGANVVDAMQNGAIVNITVSGGISGSALQVISSLTETLEVSAGAEIWTLHVSGSASFEGVVDIASNLNVGGTLKVVGMANFQSITVEGKIITSGTAPTAVLAATTGISAATTISGNDVAGNISYTAGSESLPANPLTAGEQVSLTFNSAYSAGPRVVLTAKNSASAAVRYYIDSTASGFKLYFLDTPLPSTNYSFDYLVVQ